LDKILSERAAKGTDAETLIDEFYDVLEEACRCSFQTTTVNKTKPTRRTVAWWREELTSMKKRLNALSRRYQRTREHEEIRNQREKNSTQNSKLSMRQKLERKNFYMEHDFVVDKAYRYNANIGLRRSYGARRRRLFMMRSMCCD
jgi:hypothetical protein